MTALRIENEFLQTLVNEKLAVTVFLQYGVKLQGIITDFDDTSILLRRDAHTQLVYKHAVSTIMPAQIVSLKEEQPHE